MDSTSPQNNSKVSIITPSLNSARFLRETIESVLAQTYKNVEHIIVDGCSTDGTLDILKEYPHLKWISEKDQGSSGMLDALWKAFHLSSGKYLAFLYISDGFVDANWLKNAVSVMENDKEISFVWGLPQRLSEDGKLGIVWNAEFLELPPPQKRDFLPFWLVTAEGVDANAVFRRHLFEAYYPGIDAIDDPFYFVPGCGFNYRLNTQGHLPYFLPIISNYNRIHQGQLSEKIQAKIGAGSTVYFNDVARYKEKLLAGEIKHYFRDGNGEVIGEVTPDDLTRYKKYTQRLRLRNSLKRKFNRILNRIYSNMQKTLGSTR